MKITVILCTYNRCQSLVKALESVAASVVPDSVEWDVLVVDNNSTDRTRDVVEDSCSHYPGRFRYVFESQQGKSHALNAGIREAGGEILAFMDDDVTVEPSWLQNLTASMRSGEWAGAGGRIAPEPGFEPPRWLALDGPYDLKGVLALFDLGQKAGEIHQPPYGTNMAFSRRVFEKHGGFRTDIGPRPGSEIRGEDTEFGRRLLSDGERLRYEPSAIVYHGVPEARIQKAYFLQWWFDHGRAVVREAGTGSGSKIRWRRMLRIAGDMLPMALRWVLAFDPQRRFYCKVWVWQKAGQILEVYRQSSGCRAQGIESECDVQRG